jgi:hypothetical protein
MLCEDSSADAAEVNRSDTPGLNELQLLLARPGVLLSQRTAERPEPGAHPRVGQTRSTAPVPAASGALQVPPAARARRASRPGIAESLGGGKARFRGQ